MYTSPMTDEHRPSSRPEQTFFQDPALDRVFAVVMGLAMEVSVLKSRLIVVEGRLKDSGIDIDWQAQAQRPELAARIRTEREAFIQHLLDPLLGQQKSRGAL